MVCCRPRIVEKAELPYAQDGAPAAEKAKSSIASVSSLESTSSVVTVKSPIVLNIGMQKVSAEFNCLESEAET